MADVKISGLPAATTPLAGTEVLPIVQNSTTKKVSIDNLTAGKALSSLNQTVTGNVSAVSFIAATSGQLFSGGTDATKYAGTVYRGANSWNTFFGRVPDAVGDEVVLANDFTGSFGKILSFGANDVTVNRGNLIQGTAAKGINFTANTPAAGMTSQLLNWYEEGTWTPTVTANVGTITTMGAVVGSYTRVGRQVTVMFDCTITTNGTGSSYIKVAGLPFASVAYIASGAGKEYNVTDKSLNLVLSAGSTTVGVFFYDGTYPGGDNYRLLGTLTYFV